MNKSFLTRESIKSIIKINLTQQEIDCRDFKDSLLLKQDLKVSKYNIFYLINSMHHIYKIDISIDEVLTKHNVGELVDYIFFLIKGKKKDDT